MKLYSKIKPGSWIEPLGEEDHHGAIVGRVYDPDNEAAGPDGTFNAITLAAEWGPQEWVPVPESIPTMGYLVIYGDDPSLADCFYAETEKDAKKAIKEIEGAFGYLPIPIQRSMIPAEVS